MPLPAPLTCINSTSGDFHPSVSADGATLFFGSNRLGGAGGGDLWTTTRTAE